MLCLDFGLGCRAAVFAPLLGNGILTQEDVAWRRSRRLIHRQFNRIKARNLACFDEHVSNLVSRLAPGVTIDLQPLFFNLTLDITTALVFGRSVYSLRADIDVDQAEKNERFAEDFTVAQEGLSKRFRLAPLHFLYNPKSFRRACRSVHEFVERLIPAELVDGGKENDDKKDDDASWFIREVARQSASVAEIRDQLLHILLAGRDTTACCLLWTL